MSSKHISQRTCLGCQAKKSKTELVRIVVNQNKEVVIDLIKKAKGRGAYLCKGKNKKERVKSDCLKKAIKRNAFQYAFKNKQIKSIKIPTTNSGYLGSC